MNFLICLHPGHPEGSTRTLNYLTPKLHRAKTRSLKGSDVSNSQRLPVSGYNVVWPKSQPDAFLPLKHSTANDQDTNIECEWLDKNSISRDQKLT